MITKVQLTHKLTTISLLVLNLFYQFPEKNLIILFVKNASIATVTSEADMIE